MSSPLVGNRALTVDPDAQRLHTAGLEAELHGGYGEAHESFGAAQQILANLPRTLDTVVQSAHITRDDGFTYVRAAIAESDFSILDQAQHTVGRSLEATAPFVSGTAFLDAGIGVASDRPKKARREILAQHGATLSLLGRVATVREVMLGTDARRDDETAHRAGGTEQQPYGLAHDILRRGNNGYYRVSNAMLGARQERLNGNLSHMTVWLGRAATGLAWTAVRNPSNLKAAVRTAGSRARHLRSYRAAVNSVMASP